MPTAHRRTSCKPGRARRCTREETSPLFRSRRAGSSSDGARSESLLRIARWARLHELPRNAADVRSLARLQPPRCRLRAVSRGRVNSGPRVSLEQRQARVRALKRRSAGTDRILEPIRAGDDGALRGLPPPGVCILARRTPQRQLCAYLPRQESQYAEHVDGRLPALPRDALRRRCEQSGCTDRPQRPVAADPVWILRKVGHTVPHVSSGPPGRPGAGEGRTEGGCARPVARHCTLLGRLLRSADATVRPLDEPAFACGARRRARHSHEPRSAPGAVLSVPRARLHSASRERRRPYPDRRA